MPKSNLFMAKRGDDPKFGWVDNKRARCGKCQKTVEKMDATLSEVWTIIQKWESSQAGRGIQFLYMLREFGG